MNYQETTQRSDIHKKAYVEGIESVARALEEEIALRREHYVENLFTAAESYRKDLKEAIGAPISEARSAATPQSVTEEFLFEDGTVRCTRLRIHLLGDLYASGLFFRQKAEGKHPLVVVQHGGIGSPELIAGFYGGTANYNDMLERVLLRGAHVFAPQLLLWNKETHNIPYNRETLDARLRRAGSSLAALELFTILRSLDCFEAMEDVGAFGMVGLSYGGFYTLYATALDTRIRAAVASSHFFSRETIPTVDRSFGGKCLLDDAAVAALVYPRSLVITVGKEDALFPYRAAEEQWSRLEGYCEKGGVGRDWVHFVPFDGTHEFPKDDGVLDILFAALAKESV